VLAVPTNADDSISASDRERGLLIFNDYVKKTFEKHCFECHSHAGNKAKGGLVLDSKQGWEQGGDSGRAIEPGDADASLLFQAVNYESGLDMPPRGKLSELEIARIREWIELGAIDPRSSSMSKAVEAAAARNQTLWSIQPLHRSTPPKLDDDHWSKNDIDRFIYKELKSHNLQASPDTDRATWLRRVTLILTGLLPSPEQVMRFCNETNEESYAEVIDKLLDSPRFGERWGRHWLDLARYTDVVASLGGKPIREAWRYRDYVIDAYNRDKSFDQFVREQLAGDLLQSDTPERQAEQRIATGFLSIGHWPGEASEPGDPELTLMEIAGEQIATTSTVFLGLSVGCAKCHDHKFDPIPTKDYYAFAGIFRSSWAVTFDYESGKGMSRIVGANTVLLPKTNDARHFISAPGTIWGDLRQIERDKASAKKGKSNGRTLREDGIEVATNGSMHAVAENAPPIAVGAREADTIGDQPIRIRGEVNNRGGLAPRGFLSCICIETRTPSTESSGRLELAEWLLDEENPLTARVAVNRIWHHIFGTGLVRTVDDFGMTGELPSHPELLDFVANRFRSDLGWSTKKLLREILLSRTFRQSSQHVAASFEVDPYNRYLWRFAPRRVEAEVLADTLGQLQGTLDLEPPTFTVPPFRTEDQGDTTTMLDIPETTLNKRAVYWPVFRRDQPVAMDVLSIYDFPDAKAPTGRRDTSTMPTQSLYLINSDRVKKTAASLASQCLSPLAPSALSAASNLAPLALSSGRGVGGEGRRADIAVAINLLSLRIYNRELTSAEIEILSDKLTNSVDSIQALTDIAHAMLMSSEFTIIR
jgi:mono/diheme cytochrome c family protein